MISSKVNDKIDLYFRFVFCQNGNGPLLNAYIFRINLQLAVKAETSVFLLFATRVYKRDFKYFHCNNHSPLKFLNNSLNPDINMYILRTVLFKFLEVLTRRICPIIKGFFYSWWSFPQFVLVTLMFDSRVKFDASHSMGGRVLISVTDKISLPLQYKAKSERLGKSLLYQGPEMMHYSVTSVFAVPLISLRAVRLSFSLFSIFNIFPKHFFTCAVVLLLISPLSFHRQVNKRTMFQRMKK